MRMQKRKRKGKNLTENAGMETKGKESKWKRQRKEQKRKGRSGKEDQGAHNDKEGVEQKRYPPKTLSCYPES